MPELIRNLTATCRASARLLACATLATAAALPNAPAVAQSAVATGAGTPFELAFWQSIDSSNSVALYEAYLARFPTGTFAEIARAKATALRLHAAPAVAAPTPPLTVPVADPAPPATMFPPLASPVPASPVPASSLPASSLPAAPSPMPPPAPAALDYAQVDAQPAAAAAPAETSAPAAPGGTMGQLLAALANSQASGDQTGNQAPAAPPAYDPPRTQNPGFALPPQPALSPVANVTLPPAFCSIEARNAFHANVYVPAVSAAKRNNDAAIAYMHQLQSLYDQYQLSHDPATTGAIASAARQYQQLAQTTYSMQASLVRQFPLLMAVPVVPCAHLAQGSYGQ